MPKQVATKRDGLVINVVPEFKGDKPNQGSKLFLDQYVVDFNQAQAALRCGRTKAWAESHGARLIRKYHDYVEWMQRVNALEKAQRIAMSQEEIFDAMAIFAKANVQDYFTMKEVELTEGKNKKKKVKKMVRVWKDPMELTREQAAAVKRVVLLKDGSVHDYILYDKDSNLVSLGRHMGMFSEKVILEHRHKHLHAKVDLSAMPLGKLLEMEQEFLPYLPENMKEAR